MSYTIKSTKPDFINESYNEKFDALARLGDLKTAYEKITNVSVAASGLLEIIVHPNYVYMPRKSKNRIMQTINYWISETN